MKRFTAASAIILLGINNMLHAAPPCTLPQKPSAAENLKLKAPINHWDNALPLGNGLMGGLLWGKNHKIILSLDRGDLWDERTHGKKEWWKEYTYARGKEMVDAKKNEYCPTLVGCSV
jgi:alpha-L-fucosidase 2